MKNEDLKHQIDIKKYDVQNEIELDHEMTTVYLQLKGKFTENNIIHVDNSWKDYNGMINQLIVKKLNYILKKLPV